VALEYVIIAYSEEFTLTQSTAQYNAWCRNNGDHETAGRSRVNWNQELIWKMRSELDYAWEMVEEEVPEVFDELLQTLERLLEKLKSSITGTLRFESFRHIVLHLILSQR
jgi:hypothetical protein